MLGVIKLVLGTTLFADAILLTFLLKERPSILKTVFAVYIAGIAGWTFSILLNTWVPSVLIAYFVYAFAAVFLTAQIWFAKLFPDGVLPKRWWEYWSVALGMFFCLASFVPGALFSSITFAHGYVVVHNGYIAQWYSLFVVLSSAMPVAIFLYKRHQARDHTVRIQLFYLSIGFSAFLVLIVLANSVLPVFFGIYIFNVAGPICSLLLAASVFYVIWRYRFLDIRRAVQRGVTYSVLIVIVVVAYEACLLATERYLELAKLFFPWEDDIVEPLSAAAVTIIGIFTIPLIERYFQKLTDRIFFKERYDYAHALESLSEILSTSTDFDELVTRMQESLAAVFRAERVEILFLHADGPDRIFAEHERELARSMELFEPIRAAGAQIGGIFSGEKRSGDRYSIEDRSLLRTFALQASTALARAQLFRQVREHALELEQKVAQRTVQLQAARDNERRMMLDIAHGLKTPLAVFGTRLDSSTEELQRPLKQLSDLVGDLLELARLEYIEDPELEVISLSDLVEDICDEIGTIAASRRIVLTRDIRAGVFVRSNARDLRTAVMNLAANSVKYMRENGKRKISIRLGIEGSGASLSIRDSGIGIAAADLPHIFDRFYRANASDTGGSGLGLAISKRIIELHGGTLTVQSVLDNGTTMKILLPRAEAGENRA